MLTWRLICAVLVIENVDSNQFYDPGIMNLLFVSDSFGRNLDSVVCVLFCPLCSKVCVALVGCGIFVVACVRHSDVVTF